MFESILYIKYLGFDEYTKKYKYLFEIIDDDFKEEVIGAVDPAGWFEGSAVGSCTGAGFGAIITCYESKNLPVAKNLLRLFICYEKQYGIKYYSVKEQIKYCIKYQPLFLKYKNELEKYLSLL